MLKIPGKMSPKYVKRQVRKEGKPTLMRFSPYISPEGTAYGERKRNHPGEPGGLETQQKLSSNTIPILSQLSKSQLLANPDNQKSAIEIDKAPEASPRIQAHINVKEMRTAHEQSGKDFATEHMASEHDHYPSVKTPLNLA